jgi:RNA polymerase sigma-70 factor (ECF subfamily)
MLNRLNINIKTDKEKEFLEEAVPSMNFLYSFARHLTGNPNDADDLVQDTFLKAYKFWDKYEKGTNIRAWLFRIMKNSYINRYRKEVKEPNLVDFDEIQEFYTSLKEVTNDEQDLEAKIFSGILDDDVSKALDSLPPDFKTVVILCDIEGLSYEEIADFIDIPVGTVRSRLHRGRKMLQSHLFDYAKQKGYIKRENKFIK